GDAALATPSRASSPPAPPTARSAASWPGGARASTTSASPSPMSPPPSPTSAPRASRSSTRPPASAPAAPPSPSSTPSPCRASWSSSWRKPPATADSETPDRGIPPGRNEGRDLGGLGGGLPPNEPGTTRKPSQADPERHKSEGGRSRSSPAPLASSAPVGGTGALDEPERTRSADQLSSSKVVRPRAGRESPAAPR